MSSNLVHQAVLSVEKSGHDGQPYPVRGRLTGHEGEWFRVSKKGRENYRVILVGPDGNAVGKSYRVAAGDFEMIAREEQPVVAVATPDLSIVAQNGAVVIAVRLRERVGIRPGTYVTQEESNGGVLIRSFRLENDGPRLPTAAERDKLIDRITPENVHEEFDTGGPVGREVF